MKAPLQNGQLRKTAVLPMKQLCKKVQAALFIALWLFIILVSVIDGYLTFRHRGVMHITELNPLGQELISWNAGQVWYMLIAKFFGTVITGSALLIIRTQYQRMSTVIVSAIAFLQLCLLMFLGLL
jgi:hypothetical protein